MKTETKQPVRLCGGPFAGRRVVVDPAAMTHVIRGRTGSAGHWLTVATYAPSRPLKHGAGGLALWRIIKVSSTYIHEYER
jgi:hypothetical protein